MASDAGSAQASVPTPTPGVDPRVALATSMYAAPGVYAVLVGSGMSRAAGIPTGWEVVQDLIRQIARAEGVSGGDADEEPEVWWARSGRGEPRYDVLLDALAPTDAARQALLRGYFDPRPPVGPITPTDGHRALAWLCASGLVRVIMTTNFDRLLERALEEAGASPQVIAGASGVEGMTPLVHARSTVIKLHGDWATLGMRNTPDELREYPAEIRRLLDRVLDEYGLVVVGWSGEYDVALADAIAACPSRRYPTYWATFQGAVTETATRHIAQRPTAVIDTTGADEFLIDLAQRTQNLAARAARRDRPSRLRVHRHMPQHGSPPQGWAALPLLQLRAAAAVTPATLDDCGDLRPQEREELLKRLRPAAITARLRVLASSPAAPATTTNADGAEAPQPLPLIDWMPTPGARQSTDYATYRLGGDASRGVSALLTILLPRFGTNGAVVFLLDIAASLERSLYLHEAASLWRDGLVLVSGVLPEAIGAVLPADADVSECEIHALASRADGQTGQRENSLSRRIEFASLGEPSEPLGESIGYAAEIRGGLTEHDAGELVVTAIDQMALDNGYLDPRLGIRDLRSAMGLP